MDGRKTCRDYIGRIANLFQGAMLSRQGVYPWRPESADCGARPDLLVRCIRFVYRHEGRATRENRFAVRVADNANSSNSGSRGQMGISAE